MHDCGTNMRTGDAGRKHGFTLTEILVVIVIIVLVLGMAVPVFKFITGSRSEEGAANQIAAMLARARSDAIGLQQPVGVAFFSDGSDGRAYMAEVEFAPCTLWNNKIVFNKGDYTKVPSAASVSVTSPPFYYYVYTSNTSGTTASSPNNGGQTDGPPWQWVGGPPLDIRPDTDVESLPQGIAVQTICDYVIGNGPSAVRSSDGYLAVGVIMFGADGSLTQQPYGISTKGKLSSSASLNLIPTATNQPRSHGFPEAAGVFADWDPTTGQQGNHSSLGVKSQVGLVVYPREAFVTQGFTVVDPLYEYATGSITYGNESTEEQWLDNNAQPLLINRFNGTLVRQD
jgi:prepilin-type N-terminal cleavage/methylation domain-containing protein